MRQQAHDGLPLPGTGYLPTPAHMSTRVSSANLDEALKKFMAEWDTVRASWTDSRARDFAQEYLDDLPNLVAQTRTAVDEIDALLRKVRASCE